MTDSYDFCYLTLRYMHMYLATLLNIENVDFLNNFCRNYFTKFKLKFNKRYDYSNERIFSPYSQLNFMTVYQFIFVYMLYQVCLLLGLLQEFLLCPVFQDCLSFFSVGVGRRRRKIRKQNPRKGMRSKSRLADVLSSDIYSCGLSLLSF